MKKRLQQLIYGCKIVFGYGMMTVMFAGGLTFFGFLAAVVIGGETAAAICAVIRDQIFPVIIYATTSLILLGLVTMYLGGEKALTPDSEDDDFHRDMADE